MAWAVPPQFPSAPVLHPPTRHSAWNAIVFFPAVTRSDIDQPGALPGGEERAQRALHAVDEEVNADIGAMAGDAV